MSDRTDTGQSDSIMAPVIPHIIINVESFTHWFANMQPPCIPEIPQTLRYRLLSQWAVLEIQNILFCFISMQPPVWNFEVQGCCFLDICVCECLSAVREAPSLPPAAPCFSHPMPHTSRTEGKTASVGNAPICLASLIKLRQPWLTGWAKDPEMWFLGRTLITSKLHF